MASALSSASPTDCSRIPDHGGNGVSRRVTGFRLQSARSSRPRSSSARAGSWDGILNLLVTIGVVWSASCGSPSPIAEGLERRAPLSPKQALESFQVAEGFRLELAAAEPQVTDPIAIAFDENGRLYVAEMRGYPFDPPPEGGPAGQVRLLEDENGDGVFESAQIFADRLHWPSGIACFDGGIFVTAAPDIVYLKDTTGDGNADLRRTVFTGFGTDKSEDIVNNLRWSMDHWIYGTTSYNGGTVRHAERAEDGDLHLGSNDFRFHPVTEVIEAVEGTRGDFGNAFDEWGNRFSANSGNPVIHAVFPLRHVVAGMEIERMAAPIFESERLVYPISKPEPWRAARKTYWSRWVNTTHDMRAQRFPPRELALQGYFTGGAGLEIYRGAAYPGGFRGNAFTAEPAGNLVLRTVVERSGVTFRARRATPGKEFLASTDNWFRPVNFSHGPDGCLYMVDMYREVIEDPSAMPDEILKHIDYYTGQDMGRIYRITPTDLVRPAPPRLGDASIPELVAHVEHQDGWWRSTAHRLLFERQSAAASPLLRSTASRSSSAHGRLHALWSLEGLGQLDRDTLLRALSDPHPAVRQNAVRLAESRLAGSAELAGRVARLATDEDQIVRFQVALAIPALDLGDGAAILAQILRRDPGDEWIRAAVLSGAREGSGALLEHLLASPSFLVDPDSPSAVRQLAARVAGNQSQDEIRAVLAETATVAGSHGNWIRMAAVSGIAAGLERIGSSLPAMRDSSQDPALGAEIAEVLEEAPELAADKEAGSLAERVEAIRLLSWAPREAALGALDKLLAPDEPAEVQLAAVRSLSSLGGPEVAQILVRGWRTFSPSVRREAVEVIFRREERLRPFLDAIAAGTVHLAQLDPSRTAALLDHPQAVIRARARQILARVEMPSPEEVVREYRSVLRVPGDMDRGAAVFERECATCHLLGGTGHAVGPDLMERASSPREELLVDILDPNRSVQSNFVNYRLDALDGTVVTGILARESAETVTLRRGEGIEDVVARTEIGSLTSMGLSLMPEGLSEEIEPGEMADLLSFVQSQARQ